MYTQKAATVSKLKKPDTKTRGLIIQAGTKNWKSVYKVSHRLCVRSWASLLRYSEDDVFAASRSHH